MNVLNLNKKIILTTVLLFTSILSEATKENWAVLPFEDNSKSYEAGLGRYLTEKISKLLLLDKSVLLISDDAVSNTLNKLDMQLPLLTENQYSFLSSQVNADLIITGSINEFKQTKKNQGTLVEATIAIRLIDGVSGKVCNKMIVKSNSTYQDSRSSRIDLFKNVLIQASFDVAKTIKENNLSVALVQNILTNLAFINSGKNKGYYLGLPVIVIRGKKVVAKGIVKEIEPDSAAIAIDTVVSGIQPLDKVRPIVAF